MWRSIVVLVAVTLLLPAAGETVWAKQRDVEIAEMATARPQGTVRFTGVVKVQRSKPIPGLLMLFEFYDPRGKLLTIQKQIIEEETVESGDEIDFELVGNDVPRAVSFRVRMMSGRNMELSVAKGGPYPF